MISQADVTNGLHYLLYDGHGSTRALLDAAGALVAGQRYAYDAYGNMLSGTGLALANAALTRLLYSGEQTDATGLQYLRARYYDPRSGRFNRLDPFAGNVQDPQSLHKYLYASANPVMMTDPSGEFGVSSLGVSISIAAVVTNIGLTVYSGIRHDASVGTIAFNVGHNLAIFGLIAGATFVSGPVGLAAIGTLAITALKGAYDLYVYWPEMDNVDRSIAVAMIATYAAFGIAIRPAPGVPSVYEEGASSPIPGSYISKLAIDMNRAPANSPRNSAGFPRNRTWFWRQVLQERPEWLSEANKARVEGRGGQGVRSPVVDEVWVRYHPEHSSFMGDILVHHHLAQGQYAVGLPTRVHQAWFSELHPDF